jgi:hypothetical protein
MKTHGLSHNRAYPCWSMMLYRCYNEKYTQYADYGGRGIKVCARWKASFANFLADMGPRPSINHSIERINNSRGYNPKNCHWAHRVDQQRNTRRNHFLTVYSETLTISAWAELTGISKNTILKRVRSGWSDQDAVTTPVDVRMRNKEVV